MKKYLLLLLALSCGYSLANSVSSFSDMANNKINLTPEQLAREPELLAQMLLSSLHRNDLKGVALLRPIYQKQAFQDPVLSLWIKAALARKEGDLSRAIDLYRRLISASPELFSARLQLAMALFDNKQYTAAEYQFDKLNTEVKLPLLQQTIAFYKGQLIRQEQWDIDGSLTYLNEPNINNSPKDNQVENWTFSTEKEKAQGFGYMLSADKKRLINDHFFALTVIQADGKYYWNNKKYNEFNAKIGFGGGFQNVKNTVKLTPFVEQAFYAGGERGSPQGTLHRYFNAVGVNFSVEHWLNSNWKTVLATEYSKLNYIDRNELDGNSAFAALSLFYLPNSKQYWMLGANYHRKSTRKKVYQYRRPAVRIAWGQEWGLGISTRLEMHYAWRHYYAPMREISDFAPSFYKVRQKNNEFGGSLSVWHRGIHLWGITPKITWNYHRVKSNNPLYQVNKNQILLTLTKTF
ncbi:porin family protein [Caviibacterium pharyngocola]|uniref:DUF560 domain-containing protein n=1 Tax=Caviibacterium pharyngocola TaxID=28159 RepID=A0A2M8RT49_9PAST|nr:porin family protein [Caviibacterium pharyngocola]PJG82066.1 hypothetical protein CVP04_11280 [Caviibacterium pharyngocola]